MDMILFDSDWDRAPQAIADTKTKNTTFLKLAHLYRTELKIKNWKFCLALLQPDLQGVDPYDPFLDRVTKAKIAFECKYNPWYYFREVARVPSTSGPIPAAFRANRGNIALYWSFFNHVDFGLLQPRQTGKSVSTDMLMIGIMYIWGVKTTINLITKDAKLRQANIERLKEMRDLLPDYIDMMDKNDMDNSEMLTCVRLDNRYKTSVARNDRQAADKLGRGLTIPIMHFDEVAYLNWIETTLPVALSSGNAARREAAANGQYYGNIFTTTAGNVTTRDGKYAHDFMTGGATWSESYFDLKSSKAVEMVVEKGSTGTKPLIYGAFNHRQLGETDLWLYKTLRDNNAHGEIADRDFFNIWTVGGEGSPLTDEEKRIIKEAMREPLANTYNEDGYVIRWYIEPDQIETRMANCKVMLGTDPSELLGENNDATGFVGLDIETHEVLFTGRFNETSIPVLGTFIANLLIKYENITWIPERKSTGGSLIDIVILLLHKVGIDPFKRIFNKVVDQQSLLQTEFSEIRTSMNNRSPHFYDKFKRHFGYATSGGGRYSRNALFKEALPSAIRYGGRRMNDKGLITELLALVIKNGRIDHSAGNHDDMVVSMLLAHWACILGENLEYYGINRKTVFAKAITRDVELTPLEIYKEEQNKKYKEEFETLIENLKGESNKLMATKIEMRLKAISRLIDVEEATGVGIDALILQVTEDRVRKMHENRYTGNSVANNQRYTSDPRRANYNRRW